VISVFHVLHHTEEALQLIELANSFDVVRLVTIALDADVLLNQSDAIILRCWHDLLTVLRQIELDSDAQVIRHDHSVPTQDFLIGIKHQSALLLNLAELDTRNVHDRRCVDLIGEHNVGSALMQTLGTAVAFIDAQDLGCV
jgi:hypothetical protein